MEKWVDKDDVRRHDQIEARYAVLGTQHDHPNIIAGFEFTNGLVSASI